MMNEKTFQLAVTGYYGMNNFGDDLFGWAAIEGARRHWEQCSPFLVAPQIDGIQGEWLVPAWLPKRVFGDLESVGRLTRLVFGAQAFRRASRVVYSGGSLFHGSGVSNASLLETVFSNSTELSAIGVSIGPFESLRAEREARSRLSRFEFLSLRDKASYDTAMSFNLPGRVVLSADLAATLPLRKSSATKPLERTRTIGFSPCNLPNREHETKAWCDMFIEALRCWDGEAMPHVKLICLNEHPAVGDAQWCAYVAQGLRNTRHSFELVSYGRLGLQRTCQMISELDVYCSARLHGAVIAYLTAVPFYLHEYHPKCSEFLFEIGKPQSQRLEYVASNAADLSEVLDELINRFATPTMSIEVVRDLAERSFLEAPWLRM